MIGRNSSKVQNKSYICYQHTNVAHATLYHSFFISLVLNCLNYFLIKKRVSVKSQNAILEHVHQLTQVPLQFCVARFSGGRSSMCFRKTLEIQLKPVLRYSIMPFLLPVTYFSSFCKDYFYQWLSIKTIQQVVQSIRITIWKRDITYEEEGLDMKRKDQI